MTNEETREHMDMLIAHKDKALETHPYFKRCDSCIHSEEQDGSNCYECVKGMADYFEAQPCEDCISRSELLRHQHIIYDDDEEGYNVVYVKDIKAMPPVTPQIESSEDAVSREAVDKLSRDLVHVTRDKADFLCNFWEGLNTLPPVTPERPKGKWIYKMQVMNNPYTYKCSVCKGWEKDKTKYCPNCGADMRGENNGNMD